MFIDIFRDKFYPERIKNTPNEKRSFRVRRISTHLSWQINSDWSALYSSHFKLDNSVLQLTTLKYIREQFQIQLPIGWLKKIQNREQNFIVRNSYIQN